MLFFIWFSSSSFYISVSRWFTLIHSYSTKQKPLYIWLEESTLITASAPTNTDDASHCCTLGPRADLFTRSHAPGPCSTSTLHLCSHPCAHTHRDTHKHRTVKAKCHFHTDTILPFVSHMTPGVWCRERSFQDKNICYVLTSSADGVECCYCSLL